MGSDAVSDRGRRSSVARGKAVCSAYHKRPGVTLIEERDFEVKMPNLRQGQLRQAFRFWSRVRCAVAVTSGQTTRHLPLWLALTVVALGGACGQLTETSTPLHVGNGARYRVVEELLISGIKHDLRSSDFDRVVLFARPGIGGPEVVHLGVLPAGAVVEIAGLLRRSSGLFSGLQYRVKILGPGFEELSDRDVRISDASAFRLYEGRDEFGQPILSSRYFERLLPK